MLLCLQAFQSSYSKRYGGSSTTNKAAADGIVQGIVLTAIETAMPHVGVLVVKFKLVVVVAWLGQSRH